MAVAKFEIGTSYKTAGGQNARVVCTDATTEGLDLSNKTPMQFPVLALVNVIVIETEDDWYWYFEGQYTVMEVPVMYTADGAHVRWCEELVKLQVETSELVLT